MKFSELFTAVDGLPNIVEKSQSSKMTDSPRGIGGDEIILMEVPLKTITEQHIETITITKSGWIKSLFGVGDKVETDYRVESRSNTYGWYNLETDKLFYDAKTDAVIIKAVANNKL